MFVVFDFFVPISFPVEIDIVSKQLAAGGSGLAYVATDPDLNTEIVLKLILLGPKGSASRTTNQKTIEKEIKVGMMVANECFHLVSYSEVFEWGDYFCIKMEYCKGGDLQDQIEKGHIYTEEV
jgi:serine/threonine protein kinase